MNVKRYVGRSTRDAMRLLREALGPDALILANRSCAEGVEILATSADAAEALTLGAALQPASVEASTGFSGRPKPRAAEPEAKAASESLSMRGRQSAREALGGADLAPLSTVSFQDYVRQRLRERSHDGASTGVSSKSPAPTQPQPRVAAPQGAPRSFAPVRQTAPEQTPSLRQAAPEANGPQRRAAAVDVGLAVPTRSGRGLFAQPAQPVPTLAEIAQAPAAQTAAIDEVPPIERIEPAPAASAAHEAMVQEMKSLKGMIAHQFDTLRWFDDVAREPAQAALLRQMMEAGFSLRLARTVSGKMPQGFSAAQAQVWLAAVLARNVRCLAPEAGFDAAGVYALIGPTGVGKTTTTAKIAARHVLKHGSQSVALITVDTYRMGAHEQLRSYGRILNVPVHVAHDAAALHDLLRLRQERQLVLIDTVGMGQHDERIHDLLAMLPTAHVQRVMVASAAAQPESIEQSLRAFESSQARGLVLTKLDEAVRLGGALDCAIRARLPLMGFCDGQRVPEDWQQADASRLIRRALQSRVPQAFSLDSLELSTVVGIGASQSMEPVHA